MWECWSMAEQGLAAEEHGYRASGIADMLEDAGFAVYGSEGRSFQQVLWSTATPESNRVHLFLALNDVMPEQVAKSGLDYFFAVRDALFRKSAEQPDLVNYVGGLTGLLPHRAFSIVRESKLDLLAFLGSQRIDANMFGIEYLGVEVMLYKEAFLLVADIPQGVRKLRERVAVGRERFDKAVAEWEAGGRR